MQQPPKSLLASGVVLSVLAAGLAGAIIRENREQGSSVVERQQAQIGRMLVSNAKDPEIPESEFFYELSKLLKENYVDPVTDDDKLASGAARGMIGSLSDGNSLFMNPAQFKAFRNLQKGQFEGIGIETIYWFSETQLDQLGQRDKKKPDDEQALPDPTAMVPQLRVSAVAPGGPAAEAGIQPGDRLLYIDNKWIIASELVAELRDLQKKVADKKATPDALDEFRIKVRDKLKTSITPARARDVLTLGTTSSVKVVYERRGKQLSATIKKRVVRVQPAGEPKDGAVAFRLFTGSSAKLSRLLAQGVTKLDLRNGTRGDLEEVRKCLSLVGPSSAYGSIGTKRGSATRPFTIATGVRSSKQLELIVDESTRGAAEIFALALKLKGLAKLTGPKTAGDLTIFSIRELPDGSGYTLSTGIYRPLLASTTKREGQK